MSINSKEDLISVVNFLQELSCCTRCILRLIGTQITENGNPYLHPKEYLNKLVSQQILEDNIQNGISEPCVKKPKSNICPVCLDCFNQESIEIFAEGFKSLDINSYNYSNFSFNVSFPKCLSVRAHSMFLHLKDQFPKFHFGNLYDNKDGLNDILILEPHKIFRAAAIGTFSKILDKQYHPKSHLSFLISLAYENDNTEVEKMKHIIKTKLRKRETKVSRNNISECLKDTEDKMFKKHFLLPPQMPDKSVILQKIDIITDPVYLGGRYLKFKRNVGQTPWVIDGVSVAEHNVQDILFDAISNVLGFLKSNMTFTASGREDIDVRMLGQGRPFYVKIDNPRNRQFSSEQLQEIERQVIKSKMAAVIKLQTVFASNLKIIKCGEASKKKTYRALCKTTAPNIKDAISIINGQNGELKISQVTVMRVLHRRTLMAREKTIYEMKATEILGYDDLFELEMVTQAGTYVKEFIHGDFERTHPNITSLVGCPTDIVALDCIDIDLVWPEENYSNSVAQSINS
ncbi:putative tRNA pseudouridine synthase Pus10 [Euwallacea similis]|uniref:putative tRNA pseudouridine synthase Pus10 n=1 Tax=Euwallacea similis TaxID=1736056 RepID=UPI00344DC55A